MQEEIYKKVMVTFSLNEIITILSLILAAISIVLLIIVEYVRKPSIEFLQHKDEPTPEDKRQKRMWYHLKVRNKEPPKVFKKFFDRDAALQCIARVDFLDKNTKRPLVPQITAHCVNQPEPRDNSTGYFDPSKIPTCQRIDIGFRDEMFDVLLKFEEDKSCFAADPWIVYRYPKGSEWEKLKFDADEVLLKVEIEAINLGKKEVAEYLLRNKGLQKEDVEIILTSKKSSK